MADDITPVDSGAGVDSPSPETTDTPTKDWEVEYQKLQKENQQYREKYQPYERLYGQNSDIQQFHEAAQAYADGNMDTVQEWLISNAAAFHDLSVDDYMAKFQDPEDEDDRPMTKKEARQMFQDAQKAAQEAEQQTQVSQIRSHAESLGYEAGTWEYEALLALAMRKHGNDLDAAHEEFSQFGKSDEIIQKYVEGQKEKSRSNLRANSGQAPASDRKIASWKDADAAAEEYLQSQR